MAPVHRLPRTRQEAQQHKPKSRSLMGQTLVLVLLLVGATYGFIMLSHSHILDFHPIESAGLHREVRGRRPAAGSCAASPCRQGSWAASAGGEGRPASSGPAALR
jgi:hypothetical protein